MIKLLIIAITALAIAGCAPPYSDSKIISIRDLNRRIDCQAEIVCYGWATTNAAISCVPMSQKLYAEVCR